MLVGLGVDKHGRTVYHIFNRSDWRLDIAERNKTAILLRLERSRQAAPEGQCLPGKRGVRRVNTMANIFCEPGERNKINIGFVAFGGYIGK